MFDRDKCEHITKPHPPDLAGYRKIRVEESKAKLAAFLEANPLTSSAHGAAQPYTVTAEKQALLTSTLVMAQGAAAMGIPYEVTWNAMGQPCEPWTAEELSQLAFEIAAYVKPLVANQQAFEVQLQNCGTVEEISGVEISYQVGNA